jgi:hypothetical protein
MAATDADPFNYQHRQNLTRRKGNGTNGTQYEPFDEANISSDVNNNNNNNNTSTNNFGLTAYIILFITCSWFASFAHTLILTFAYSPLFPETLPFDRDVPLEIIGPVLGYLYAIYFIGTSYGKVMDTNSFFKILIYISIGQTLHFTLFWFEDVFVDKYKPNALLQGIYAVINGSSFLPSLCCYFANTHLKNDESFKPKDSCLQNCLSGCCVWCGRCCLLFVIMPLVMGVLFGENNGSARFNFDFGGDDFGGFGGSDGGSSSYDYNGGRMTRSRALRSLNLGSGASLRDIKSSYRNLAKLYHPDKCGRGDDGMSAKMCEKKFIQVKEGYEYLSGKNRKERRGFRL